MILAGITGTHNVGEITPTLDLVARLGRGSLEAECWWTPADKIESPGWAAGGHLDWSPGWIVAGAGYTYQHTEAWDKDAIWARVGLRLHGVQAIYAHDLTSQNEVRRVELRVTGRVGWLVLEPHGFVESYVQAGRREVGYGTGVRIGVGH